MPEAARRGSFRRYCASLLVLVTALSGCAAGARNDHDANYVFRTDDDFVRLAAIEPGAPPNSHPFAISASRLNGLLAGVHVRRAVAIGRAAAFSKEELEIIVPPLVSALSKAGPNQDVTFAVTGRRGLFGSASPRTVTTGRLFARGGSLNLIFGLMQERLDPSTFGYEAPGTAITPGARSRRIGDTIWKIEPGRGEFHGERGDWLVFDRSAIPSAPVIQAAPPMPDAGTKVGGEVPAKAQEIENRLRVLDELRKRGVITEQEYLERRRAILEQL